MEGLLTKSCFCILLTFSVQQGSSVEMVDYGEECSAEKYCNFGGYQVCEKTLTPNICQCINPDNTWYDPKDKTCKIRANNECGQNAQPCVEFSFCSTFNSSVGVKHCACKPPLTESRGKCFTPIDAICTEVESAPCDTESFIECSKTSGKCACADNSDIWYEAATKSCVLLQGSECRVEKGQQSCVEEALCLLQPGEPENHRCACVSGRSAKDRRCIAYRGEKCDEQSDNICKTSDHLTCVEGKCVCVGGQDGWFDSELGSCALLQGAKCTPNKVPCSALSHCDDNGVCACNTGLSSNKNRRCILPYGKVCANVPKNWKCDDATYLECNAKTEKCACKDSNTKIYEDGTCKITALSNCNPFPGNQECIQNSKCSLAISNTYKCVCDAPLQANGKSICVRGFNSTCDDDDAKLIGDCDSNGKQICTKGRCACSDADNMDYNQNLRICELKLNSPCSRASGSAECAAPFTCRPSGKCGCDESKGLEYDGDKGCAKPYGISCSAAEIPQGLCNTKDFLTCVNGRCDCDSNHKEAGAFSKLCVGNLNAACKTDANCFEKLVCDLELGYCVSRAVWQHIINSELTATIIAFTIIFNYFRN